MNFEWDTPKASSNLLKHKVGSEEASREFLDARRIETFDGRDSYDEDRWKAIGLVGPVLLTVVYTVRGRDADVIRLISARKADSYECSKYREI